MDIMIPYLGRITRLEVESKSAFHIAGVQSGSAAEKVELENKKGVSYKKRKSSICLMIKIVKKSLT